MFPRLSETFILNEVLEIERQGVPLKIFSLKRPADEVSHPQTALVRGEVSYLPEQLGRAPLRTAQAQWHVWRRHPRQWRHSLRNAVRRLRATGDRGDLLAFAQACCVVRDLGEVRHLHAHYANVPSKVALLVHRLATVSYSITTHAKDIFQNDPFSSPKLRERMLRARFIIANSQFSANHIRDGLQGQGEIRVVHNGLDLAAFPFRRDEPRQPLILGVGRLVEKKGFAHLLTACQVLCRKQIQFSCEIIGTGALSASLKEQIRSLGLGDRVKLVGPIPQHVLWEHYARATVFALPCVLAADGDRDILPNALKEAMAVGVPVLTTRLDGIDELIEEGVSGWLVPPGNASALAEALIALLTDAGRRRQLALGGRQVIEQRFDRRENFAQLRTLLESAVSGSEFPARAPQAKVPSTYDASCVR